MYLRLGVALYVVYFTYRFYFWDGTSKELLNVFLNSFFDVASVLALVGFVYAGLEKRWLKQQKLLFMPAAILSVILFCFILIGLHWVSYTVTDGMSERFKRTFNSFGFQIFDVLTVVLVGATGSYSYIKFKEAERVRREADALIIEKQAAELRALKEQINPHFIFNSLNTIYFTIDKHNYDAREIVSLFADLLRYQLYECNKPVVPVSGEINFIKRYVDLSRLRFGETKQITFSYTITQQEKFIPPLLLIPFVENSVKHSGNFAGAYSVINISLQTEGDRLFFTVVNTKGEKGIPENDADSSGIGNKNVQRRLELIFKDTYVLHHTENETEYAVRLEIPL